MSNYRPRSPNPYNNKPTIPGWLVMLLAVALVFGGYYLWIGIRDFLETGGQGIIEATELAEQRITATAERSATLDAVIRGERARFTAVPTATDVPPCQDFEVIVTAAIVRERATTNSALVEQIPLGETVCVIAKQGDWYMIDLNPRTRRLEAAYLRDDLITASNPTLTPSRTFTPLPTVTPLPNQSTATPTSTATATETPNNVPTIPPPPMTVTQVSDQ